MNIIKKSQIWVKNGFITQEQADKIIANEQAQNVNIGWKLMFWIAGLLIGLGVVLMIGANWRYIPAPVKLMCDFIVWGGILYGVYWSCEHQKEHLKELFLALAFLFVGATIGLIAQIFHLNGGWQSFAGMWALLSVPFVLFSRVFTLNLIWVLVLLSGIDLDQYVWRQLEWMLRHHPLCALFLGTAVFGLLGYAGKKAYRTFSSKVVLPKAFAALMIFMMYVWAVVCGGLLSVDGYHITAADRIFIHIFVFAFLGIRLLMAMYDKNMVSFIKNTYIAEMYILFLFFSCFGHLLTTGIGFVIGGFVLLGVLYMLKKTAHYIKTLEFFK